MRTEESLRLRDLTTTDAAALERIYGNDETTRFLSFTTMTPSDVEAALRTIAEQHAARPQEVHTFAAELDGDLVGVGRLQQGIDWHGQAAPDHVTVGFALRSDVTERGLGRLLLAALAERAWVDGDAAVLWGAVDPGNHASARLLRSRGFEYAETTHHQERKGLRRPSDVYVTRRSDR